MSGFANVTGQPIHGGSTVSPEHTAAESHHATSTSVAKVSFEAFVNETRVGLTRAISAHHHPQLAADLVAEAYAWAWENWDRVEAMRNPGGYLFRLADRLGHRRNAKSNREPTIDPSAMREAPWFDSAANDDMAKILSGLPPRQRAAVLLIHAYEYSYREAAAILDIPVTTITNDVIRGVKALREFGTQS